MVTPRHARYFVVALLASTTFVLTLPVGRTGTLRAQGAVNTWQSPGPTNVGGPVSDILTDPADPNLLIVSSDGGGLWRSTDAGASWQVIDVASMPSLLVRSLARNPAQPAVIFAASSTGILRSVDRGNTWRALSAFPASDVGKVAVSGDGQLVVASVAGSWRLPGLYQSTDGGDSWVTVSPGGGGPHELAFSRVLPRRGVGFLHDSGSQCSLIRFSATGILGSLHSCASSVAFATDDPEIVYFGGAETVTRYRFTETGSTTLATAALPGLVTALWVDPANSNFVVAGATDLWRSIDGGATFTQISDWSQSPFLPGGGVHAIRADAGFNGTTNRRVYVATEAGVFRTDNIQAVTPATGWTSLNNGLVVSRWTAGFAADGAAVAANFNQDVIRLPQGSTVATPVTTTTTFHERALEWMGTLVLDPQDASYVYVADLSASTLSRSSDGGATFAEMSGPSTTRTLKMILGDPLDGNRLYAFYPGELFRTSNARAATPTWEGFSVDAGGFPQAAFAPGSSSILWMANETGGFVKSADMNAPTPTFTTIGPNVSPGFFFAHNLAMAASDGQIGYAVGPVSTSAATRVVFRTADGGITWTRMADLSFAVRFLTTHPGNPDWVIAATGAGIYQSTDGGANWTLAFPTPVAVASLSWRGTTLLAGTLGRGLWSIDLTGEPYVTTQPANQFVPTGGSASFTVWAAGAPAVSYLWQVSSDGGGTWTDLANTAPYSGVTTATLTITGATETGRKYRSLITNSLGTVPSDAATLTVAATVTSIAAGSNHTCAVTSAGGVSCWGFSLSQTRPTPVAGLPKIIAVTGGSAHTCALSSVGGVSCWNGVGTPAAVAGLSSGVTAIEAGASHTCAITTGSGVVCWGNNDNGQLGDGTTTSRSTPAPVSGLSSGVAAISAGGSHTCALLSTGSVTCWGWNFFGQLGDNTVTMRLTPVAVTGLSGATMITAGGSHTCALTSGGIMCWGSNLSGQLANGTANHATPVPVTGLPGPMIAVAAGGSHNCAVSNAGAVLCWGSNLIGEAGGPLSSAPRLPTVVPRLSTGATAITAGMMHSCALGASGVLCWGLSQSRGNGAGDGEGASVVRADFGITANVISLNFTATKSGASLTSTTPAQSVGVSIRGAADTWTATADQPWLQITGGSGTGSRPFTVAITNPGDVIGGATLLHATITILSTTDSLPVMATVPVTLTVVSTATMPPFGVMDWPANGAASGSIPVSGWAMDNLGVTRVELWRDLVPGETTPPYGGPGPGTGKVFIANMSFVAGARPDIEALYPGLPFAARAGWGYLMLPHGLWNRGNGTYTLHAFAYDVEGNSAALGSKTITVSTSTETRPFGNIDTPGQGDTVTGSFWNYGWALTPHATPTCTIAPSGVQVRIDSGPLTPVSYGDLRTDIASGFPGYTNTSGAGGSYFIDTSALANGTHQIGWLVADDCGRATGIGSRFFDVLNGGSSLVQQSDSTAMALTGSAASAAEPIADAVEVRGDSATSVVAPNASGVRIVTIARGERVEVQLPPTLGTYQGYQVVNGERRALPLGSSLDAGAAIFYWEPAPAFLGSFELEFVSTSGELVRVRAVVGSSVQHVIDTPQPGDVPSTFVIAGWAIDEAAADGSGIDTVHVWAYPSTGAPPMFLGVADYGDTRPDIGALFGDAFAGAAYGLRVSYLSPGAYDIVVYPHSSVTGDFHGARVVRVTVRE